MTSDQPTSVRFLRLLDLLQARRHWRGEDLADRLGVDVRTLRRDVAKLRGLGYHVEASRGTDGGYSLEAGHGMPPLLLTEDETVAIAASLGLAATSTSLTGVDELAVTALAKLEQVLPPHLRRRVGALRTETTAVLPRTTSEVDPSALAALALACRDSEVVHVHYSAVSGEKTRRDIEPIKLVHRARHWYVACWDRSRSGWRTLRVDRITKLVPGGERFAPRTLPEGGVAGLMDAPFGAFDREYELVVSVDAPLEAVGQYLGRYAKDLEADGSRTRWRLADARPEVLVAALVWLPWTFTVDGDPEVLALVGRMAERFSGALAHPKEAGSQP